MGSVTGRCEQVVESDAVQELAVDLVTVVETPRRRLLILALLLKRYATRLDVLAQVRLVRLAATACAATSGC